MTARRGFTLLEILLVVVVLAVIAGMVWPAMLRFVNERAIKEAGEEVRAELDRTRFRAIDVGSAYQFLYEPDGPNYIAIPARQGAVAAGGMGAGPSVSTNSPAASFSGKLADGLVFRGDLTAIPAGASLGTDALAGLPNSASLQRVQWSAPIVYLPSGTAEDAVFQIVDENGRYIELNVRGLTGMARAGPLRREATP